jgi:hypothetical protein
VLTSRDLLNLALFVVGTDQMPIIVPEIKRLSHIYRTISPSLTLACGVGSL